MNLSHLSRVAVSRTLSRPVDALSWLGVRHAGDSTAFTWLPPSLHCLRSVYRQQLLSLLFVRGFFDTMAASDFSPA